MLKNVLCMYDSLNDALNEKLKSDSIGVYFNLFKSKTIHKWVNRNLVAAYDCLSILSVKISVNYQILSLP